MRITHDGQIDRVGIPHAIEGTRPRQSVIERRVSRSPSVRADDLPIGFAVSLAQSAHEFNSIWQEKEGYGPTRGHIWIVDKV
ncbi:hypothetical protein BFL35_01480 [Clavibacter michiganensis]|nr:hypothetical protein BFL35_01480 [Clavibacter michiganensis]